MTWNPNKKKPKGYREIVVRSRKFWYDPCGVKIIEVSNGDWMTVDQAELKGMDQNAFERLIWKRSGGIQPSDVVRFLEKHLSKEGSLGKRRVSYIERKMATPAGIEPAATFRSLA